MKKISQRDLLDLQARNEFGVTPLSGKSLLGLDYGEKFCGFAYAVDGVTVLPYKVIKTGNLISEIDDILKTKKVDLLVLGLPIGIKGEENHICKKIRSVSKELVDIFSLEIDFVNERYSSQKTINNRTDRVDDLAAVNILEYYLSQKS